MSFTQHFIGLFIESAPWLLMGFSVAGLMKAFVPSQVLAKHLGEPGLLATVKAALLGAPLPLCSCGVIPAALGLRRSGASKAATTSFLISTPETGVDSVTVSYAMMGPFMAIIRPIAAISTAITAGLLVGPDKNDHAPQSSEPVQSCCARKTAEPESAESCCSKVSEENSAADSIGNRLRDSMKFTFVDLIRDISLWLIIGLGIAAVVKTYVPPEFLTQWGDGFMAFVVMALIGVPMYICALASTPIAAGLLFSGVSPGATLVFMLVGPATNIATIGLVRNELGNRALAAYLGSVVGVGFGFGYLTNYLAGQWNIDFLAQTQTTHAMINTPIATAAAMVLAGLIV
ncbi:MAG: SO_0444 family Cu/Zn efflux transporter, partial [Gammaproteobacteria bacterium]|nr:SO_0444 family Cu/Zn efflux transporter [Gammaproteobacteria bacterium]